MKEWLEKRISMNETLAESLQMKEDHLREEIERAEIDRLNVLGRISAFQECLQQIHEDAIEDLRSCGTEEKLLAVDPKEILDAVAAGEGQKAALLRGDTREHDIEPPQVIEKIDKLGIHSTHITGPTWEKGEL